MEPIFTALLLSTIAGLSTSVGSIIALIMKKPSNTFISFIMGFSAGVMILVSFVELLQEGIQTNGMLVGMLFFLLGMGIMLLIDITVTHYYEFEDDFGKEEMGDLSGRNSRQHRHGPKNGGQHRHRHRNQLSQQSQMRKTSVLVTLGVFIHNFPEGMATFIGTLKEFELGILITVAIALHNIPEGIAIATTISSHNKSKFRPFLWSFVSGISEPLGALLVGFVLFPFINDVLLGAMLSVVGGFMVYISLDELLPMSRSLGKEHLSILGIAAGMLVMAFSLAILQ
ncbi:MAG: zinc transporter ZupT [Candidatus Lokiarchaeota archaeon]|nr:zinc transporter ZupT [Candidatus Lokiarchaeota archaeon]